MDGAKNIIDDKIAKNEIRKRDIGWIRVNIEENPDLDWEGLGRTDQMVVNSKVGFLNRYLSFQLTPERSKIDEEKVFAAVVRELTGDWFKPIPCNKI